MADKDFDLPAGCSVDYELTVVEMLKALSRTTAHDAIEEYCRSYMEEEGLRPTAAQTFRAGHNPVVVSQKYGSWFAFLRAVDLLGDNEAAVVDAYGDTLRAIQNENITKSYKLIAIRALLHDGALRTGDEIARNADTSRELLLADPRLARDVPLKEFPDLKSVPLDKWARYWGHWPIAHLTGTGSSGVQTDKLFRLESSRFVPTFTIDDEFGDTFDSMVAELIEYRLASYVLNKVKSSTRSWTCRLTYSDGHPVVRLDRRQHPDLPSGDTTFIADGVLYDAPFTKGSVTVATREGTAGNALPGLLRQWFGPSAGHPGTSHSVEIEQVDNSLLLRPSAPGAGELDIDYVPLFGDYTVACGPNAQAS
jgi:hypothetical protein